MRLKQPVPECVESFDPTNFGDALAFGAVRIFPEKQGTHIAVLPVNVDAPIVDFPREILGHPAQRGRVAVVEKPAQFSFLGPMQHEVWMFRRNLASRPHAPWFEPQKELQAFFMGGVTYWPESMGKLFRIRNPASHPKRPLAFEPAGIQPVDFHPNRRNAADEVQLIFLVDPIEGIVRQTRETFFFTRFQLRNYGEWVLTSLFRNRLVLIHECIRIADRR